MKLQHSAQTDIGKSREVNQDQFGVSDILPDGSQLFVMCDGMGGHLAGEVASQKAVETVLETFPTISGPDRPAALTQSLVIANKTVYEDGRGNMGTTAVALLLYKNIAFIANVGDSRAYLVRGEQLRQLSLDHSFVQEQVRAGMMTPLQAKQSKVGNIITRAVGHQREVLVDMFREPVQQGDIYLLCSDGLHGYVDEAVITNILLTNEPQEATSKLIEVANAAGGLDNITAVVVRVDELDEGTEGDPLLASLLAQTPRPTIVLPETNVASGPTGTAKMPTMSDDPIGPAPVLRAVTGTQPAGPTTPPHPIAASAPPPERGLNLWGALGSLLVLAMIAGGLYYFDMPPFSLLGGATATPGQPVTLQPTLIPTVTSVISATQTVTRVISATPALITTPISGTRQPSQDTTDTTTPTR